MNTKYPVDLKFPPRILSGVQPTMDIHLGHYFGALKQHIEFHHEYPGQAFYLIADYHSLTKGIKKDDVRFNNSIIELATMYLALGLDPSKAFLYRQSDIKEIFELTWILNCITPSGELSIAPTYKSTNRDSGIRTSGLLTYPVLMAADILSLKASIIPVGTDQFPYVEIVRDIAKRVNNLLDEEFFPIPAPIIGQNSLVRGIDGKKMSSTNSNHINLFLPFNELKERVNRIVTSSNMPTDPVAISECNVFHLYQMVAPVRPVNKADEMRQKYITGSIGYQDAKRELLFELQDHFSAFEQRYHELKNNPDYIMDILREGFVTVRREARSTLLQLRSLIGIHR
jgi:tryptophanyl-tRNA synthetase